MKESDNSHISIIGTGMIGAGLAALFTGNGYHVTMLALDNAHAATGKLRYEECYKDLISLGLVTEKQASACARFFATTQDYAAIADTDMIFECVKERLESKEQVYELIERHCHRFQAIASTTSAISADDLARTITQKEKLLVAHPWNPPHLVPCVELVPNKSTCSNAIKTTYDLLESAGRKVVVMKKAAPGFIGNRLQHALYREAVHMVESGIASPEDIDKTLKYSFVPRYTSIGIFEHFDYAGLDMVTSIDDYLFPDLCNADKTQEYVRSRYEAGNLGQKTGQGVYDWTNVDMNNFRIRAAKPYFAYFNWKLPADDQD